MTKDNKCASRNKCESSSSSSSADSSEVCYKVKCEPKCDKPKCKDNKCKCLSPEKILCKYRNAVVEVHSEFILLGTGAAGATGGTPLGANSRADIIVEGNGFFIKGHYI